MNLNKNLPNYLTMLRIILVPFIVLTFYFEDSIIAHRVGGALFIIASLTDFLDGYLARKYNISSNFGRVFDPIADKVLVSSTLVMLVKTGQANEIACLIILARELILSGMREFLVQAKISLPVSEMGKIKTIIQMTAISILIIGERGSGIQYIDIIGQFLLWIAILITVISGYNYYQSCKHYFTNN